MLTEEQTAKAYEAWALELLDQYLEQADLSDDEIEDKLHELAEEKGF